MNTPITENGSRIARAQEALTILLSVAPRPWDPHVCVQRLIVLRGRSLVMEMHDLAPEVTVASLRTAAADYIFTPVMPVGPARSMALTHGLAHVLLEHPPATLLDSDTFALKLSPFPQGCGYQEADEQEAELFAKAFVSELVFPDIQQFPDDAAGAARFAQSTLGR